MIRKVSQYAFALTAALLTVGILVLGTFLVLVAVPDLTSRTANVEPTPLPSPSPVASPRSPMALSPVGIEMPSNATCDACHLTTAGSVGTKPIPVMAHPLHGWRDCTACHATGSLVKTAPGHSSMHKDDCLVCHKVREVGVGASKPPVRPEHMGGDRPCTSCHGLDQHAPLPEAMKDRGNNCWICHNGAEFKYLFETASPAAESAAPPVESAAPAAASAEPGAVGYVPGGNTLP